MLDPQADPPSSRSSSCPASIAWNTSGCGSRTRLESPGASSRSGAGTSWPSVNVIEPSAKVPILSFGPCRSAIAATGRPNSFSRGADRLQPLRVILLPAMAEGSGGNTSTPARNRVADHLRRRTCRAEGGDDLGLAVAPDAAGIGHGDGPAPWGRRSGGRCRRHEEHSRGAPASIGAGNKAHPPVIRQEGPKRRRRRGPALPWPAAPLYRFGNDFRHAECRTRFGREARLRPGAVARSRARSPGAAGGGARRPQPDRTRPRRRPRAVDGASPAAQPGDSPFRPPGSGDGALDRRRDGVSPSGARSPPGRDWLSTARAAMRDLVERAGETGQPRGRGRAPRRSS